MKIHLRNNITLNDWERSSGDGANWVRDTEPPYLTEPRKYVCLGKLVDDGRYGIVFGSGLNYLRPLFISSCSIECNDGYILRFDAQSDDEAKEYVDGLLLRLDKLAVFT